MQVVNKKMCVIVILVLVIIESCTLFLMYKSYGNKNNTLDEVNLNINNSNMFAIMLEQEDGTYKEDTTNTWPTSGYTYNASMSGCIDINGNRIDNALTYDKGNNKASVNTTNTSYCYLYFSILPDNLYDLCKNYNNIDECIKNESEDVDYVSGIWDSTLEEDGYRYIGTDPNNYICFGTTDKATCTGNTSQYMYRIIGIFKDAEEKEHLKLIKRESIGDYQMHNTQSDIDWDESDLYKGINGSYFLTNTTYSYMQNSTWLNKIEDWDWTATTSNNEADNNGFSYGQNTPKTIYLHEMNRSSKTNQTCYYSFGENVADCSVGEWKIVEDTKIGLMYLSDYALAMAEIEDNIDNEYCGLDKPVDCDYELGNVLYQFGPFEASWMHSKHNNNSEDYEWTMTLFGFNYGYFGYIIDKNRSLKDYDFYHLDHITRPTFYTTSDVKIIGGIGTIDDPFRIN